MSLKNVCRPTHLGTCFLLCTGHGSPCNVGENRALPSLGKHIKNTVLGPPPGAPSQYTWDGAKEPVHFLKVHHVTGMSSQVWDLPRDNATVPTPLTFKKNYLPLPNLLFLLCSQSQLRVSLPICFSSKHIYLLHDRQNCLLKAQSEQVQTINEAQTTWHVIPAFPPQSSQGHHSSGTRHSPSPDKAMHRIVPYPIATYCIVLYPIPSFFVLLTWFPHMAQLTSPRLCPPNLTCHSTLNLIPSSCSGWNHSLLHVAKVLSAQT